MANWVAENFNLTDYGSEEELLFDIKQRFEEDGMYFPEEAIQNVGEVWRERFDIEADKTRAEIDMQVREMFGNVLPETDEDRIQIVPEIATIDLSTLATTQEEVMVEERPPFEQETGFFRGLGKRLSGFFGRFRR